MVTSPDEEEEEGAEAHRAIPLVLWTVGILPFSPVPEDSPEPLLNIF